MTPAVLTSDPDLPRESAPATAAPAETDPPSPAAPAPARPTSTAASAAPKYSLAAYPPMAGQAALVVSAETLLVGTTVFHRMAPDSPEDV